MKREERWSPRKKIWADIWIKWIQHMKKSHVKQHRQWKKCTTTAQWCSKPKKELHKNSIEHFKRNISYIFFSDTTLLHFSTKERLLGKAEEKKLVSHYLFWCIWLYSLIFFSFFFSPINIKYILPSHRIYRFALCEFILSFDLPFHSLFGVHFFGFIPINLKRIIITYIQKSRHIQVLLHITDGMKWMLQFELEYSFCLTCVSAWCIRCCEKGKDKLRIMLINVLQWLKYEGIDMVGKKRTMCCICVSLSWKLDREKQVK